MGSTLCVLLHPLCRQSSIQSTKDFLLCQQSIIGWDILAVNEGDLDCKQLDISCWCPFSSVIGFHFSYKTVNYSSHWVYKAHLLLFKSFECMSLQTHSEIISHFPLHQQSCAEFQNPWMLLLDFFFTL